MELNLKGKNVLVTGGCHGIGLSIGEMLREEGCVVQSICRHNGFDLGITSDCERASRLYAQTDILINNVGGGGRWKDEDWQLVYNKNVIPMVTLTSKLVKHMTDNGWGRVITISSIQGKEGGGRPGFAMAKSAQIAYMKAMAGRKYKGITFNTVCPGAIWIDGKEQDTYAEYGQTEDVASLVTFLCSDKAKWINGACITVDNGFSRSY